MTYHDPDVHVTITPTVAESLCDKAHIWRYDGQHRLSQPERPGVPVGAWYDAENERWTWALDEATRWAVVKLAGMDPEWEDATR